MTRDEALYRLAKYVAQRARWDGRDDLSDLVEALRPGPACAACAGTGRRIVRDYYDGIAAETAPCRECEGRGWTR